MDITTISLFIFALCAAALLVQFVVSKRNSNKSKKEKTEE